MSDTNGDLSVINKLFVRSLLAYGKQDEVQCDEACRLAAKGYMALRDSNPREAERLNGVLHALTQANHPKVKRKNHVEST